MQEALAACQVTVGEGHDEHEGADHETEQDEVLPKEHSEYRPGRAKQIVGGEPLDVGKCRGRRARASTIATSQCKMFLPQEALP